MVGKMFFHNSFHVKDYGANFHLQKWQKNKKYLKLGNVNVGLANMRSMLNIDIFFGSFLGVWKFYPKCVYVSVRKHFFARFDLNLEQTFKNHDVLARNLKSFSSALCYSLGEYFKPVLAHPFIAPNVSK